jgi:hypothetical protein
MEIFDDFSALREKAARNAVNVRLQIGTRNYTLPFDLIRDTALYFHFIITPRVISESPKSYKRIIASG